ncbi:hypothetical protein G3I61_07105, partial [Streptomyces diastaticus]|nr:hypothetical protein [Streptomyces diastaticus]
MAPRHEGVAPRHEGAAASVPARLAAVFLPAPLPREGRVAFWDPEGGPVTGLVPADDTDAAPLPGAAPGGSFVAGADPADDGAEEAAAARPGDGFRPAGVQELTVVRPHGAGVRRRTTPAVSLPLDEALPLLVRARHDPAAHPATACWGAAA